MKDSFLKVAVTPQNPNWEALIARPTELYNRPDEIRSHFARDYTRILHSMAYRRLKHKTQVFFNVDNDHICTRMEHVAHVESVAYTVARYLGLNDELTKAIAFGHDLGHAPFGHHGERVLSEISLKHLGEKFWHERNGLRMVDEVELLEDNCKVFRNLDLTYAVRDGIISHCGEIDDNGIAPRAELIDLKNFTSPGQYQPATWEGCVVKIADKIAYIGRDIEDAVSLGFLDESRQRELEKMAAESRAGALNTTVIMHELVIDICKNSSPESGIRLSAAAADRLKRIKDFNTEYIYKNERFIAYQHYSALILNTLFNALFGLYDGGNIFGNMEKFANSYPRLGGAFIKWLVKYCDADILPNTYKQEVEKRCANKKIYARLADERTYAQAIIDFISGMTDAFAVKLYGELLAIG